MAPFSQTACVYPQRNTEVSKGESAPPMHTHVAFSLIPSVLFTPFWFMPLFQ